ncbi:MAG: ABZJ_00895 family protein [Pseudomonadota bacterium]
MTVRLFRYACVFFAALVLIELLLFGVGYVMQGDFRNLGMGLIPFMGAALFEGTKHAQGTRDAIPHPWKQSGVMTVVGLGLSVLLALPFVIGMPNLRAAMADYAGYVAGFALVLSIVAWLVTRFFLTFGAKNHWKAQDRQ